MPTKRYAIKEMFYTLQGEGFHAGRAAVFCRFSGCNLWSGLEKSREKAACRFCDTDFIGIDGTYGGRYEAQAVVDTILSVWQGTGNPMVVFTGGEPLLQLDEALIETCKQQGIYVAVETNGTKPVPKGIDWVCVSPKPRSTIVVTKASELKLVYPQPEAEMHPSNFEHFEADYRYLQPLYNDDVLENRSAVVQFCLQNPEWRLSIQMQKILTVR